MNTTSRPTASLATENFDSETLALLEAVEVPLPDILGMNLDLNIAFGTPLEMYEPWLTSREVALNSGTDEELVDQFFARRHAAFDIRADDPSITTRVRERLVDVLLPYAAQLRTAPPAAAPLPAAA
ncbi:hypothetical protein GT030_30025 [Streptomyces sp. SID1328]|uniref:hypothetical protein n=1 Tax=Streptomyces sp. SID1328 TaxID=2690250 RepID=UPI00136EB6E3|nr:hypothetical protein [Streptomyces sp. SID1328]MYV42990.1 hypothetical protein [Streptomyces sp. SID1328]